MAYRKKSYKLFFALLFILFGVMLVLIVLGIYGYVYVEKESKRIDTEAAKLLESRKQQLGSFVSRADEQLTAVTESRLFLGFLEGRRSYEEAAALFVAIAKSNPSLMRLRYIDVSGNEVIRVNREQWGGRVALIPVSGLQAKHHRRYFKETMKQEPGSVWHSPLDLNIEEGAVEVPYRPTIRVGTPVDYDGKVRGMVMINLHMGPFLDAWREAGVFDLYLTDGSGALLLHPQRRYDWSGIVKTGEHVPSPPPEGAYTYTAAIDFKDGQGLKLQLRLPDGEDDKIGWNFVRTMGLSFIVLTILAVILAFFVARIPERLYQQLRSLNGTLERKVETKTADLKALNDDLVRLVRKLVGKEKELRGAYENASRSAKARSEFLGSVGHELRTPLNAVVNFAEVIREDFDEMLTDPALQEATRLYLERLYANARHLARLIDNLLDISRIASGSYAYHVAAVTLNPLLAEAVDRARPRAEGKGLELRVRLPGNELGVRVDSRRLLQILVNILATSVRLTERGQIELAAEEADGAVVVEIRDTGESISPELEGAIFHPFTEVDRFDEGTGLGLGLVRQMCNEMQIRLHIESKEGEGNRYRLEIPAAFL